MQTLFETEHYRIYRNEGLTYLKNGVVNQIETGQCNTLLNKLYGLSDEQAEEVIKNANIKIIKKSKSDCMYAFQFIETNISQKIYRGELVPYFYVRMKHKCITHRKSFKTLDEARKWRDSIRGYTPYPKKTGGELKRETIEKCIGRMSKGTWNKYRVRVYRNRKVYYKLTNTIEEARAFRDEVSQIKSVRYRKQNEILQRFFMP